MLLLEARNALETTGATNSRLETQIAQLQSQIQSHVDAAAHLQSRIDELQGTNVWMEGKIRSLEDRLKSRDERLLLAHDELLESRLGHEKAVKLNRALEQEVAETHQTIDTLLLSLDDAQESERQAEARASLMRASLDKAESILAGKDRLVEELRDALAQVEEERNMLDAANRQLAASHKSVDDTLVDVNAQNSLLRAQLSGLEREYAFSRAELGAIMGAVTNVVASSSDPEP